MTENEIDYCKCFDFEVNDKHLELFNSKMYD